MEQNFKYNLGHIVLNWFWLPVVKVIKDPSWERELYDIDFIDSDYNFILQLWHHVLLVSSYKSPTPFRSLIVVLTLYNS